MDAVVGAELLLEVEGLVTTLVVVVADHVVGAGDHAAGAPGADAEVDDLRLQLLPLRDPSLGSCGRGCLGLGHGHGAQDTPRSRGAEALISALRRRDLGEW
jgi:hypothetical protein